MAYCVRGRIQHQLWWPGTNTPFRQWEVGQDIQATQGYVPLCTTCNDCTQEWERVVNLGVDIVLVVRWLSGPCVICAQHLMVNCPERAFTTGAEN